MSTPGDFGMNGKKPLPNFKDFYSHTFCDYAVVYVGLWNVRQLAKISLVHIQNFGGVASRVPWGWRDSYGKTGDFGRVGSSIHVRRSSPYLGLFRALFRLSLGLQSITLMQQKLESGSDIYIGAYCYGVKTYYNQQ